MAVEDQRQRQRADAPVHRAVAVHAARHVLGRRHLRREPEGRPGRIRPHRRRAHAADPGAAGQQARRLAPQRAREPARRAAVPRPRRRRHAPRQRPRHAHHRRRAARAAGGRGQDAEARAPDRGRRGVHPLLEGVHPVGALEPERHIERERAAEPGRDPPQPQLDRRRRPVRRRARRALRPA